MEYKLPTWDDLQATPERVAELRKQAFSYPKLKNFTFAADDGGNSEITSVARKFVDNFSDMEDYKRGLLLYGNVGAGKSFIAACIANGVIDKGKSCLFTDFHEISFKVNSLPFEEKSKYIEAFKEYDLLVIDDFGSERDSEFMNDLIYTVINERLKSEKPMVVTTNFSGDDFKHPASKEQERVFSRLFEMCIPVEVKGTDRRKLKLKNDTGEARQLLGL